MAPDLPKTLIRTRSIIRIPMEFKNNRRLMPALIGIVLIGFALAAGRLGLSGFPGLCIGQIVLAVTGLSCLFIGLVVPRVI